MRRTGTLECPPSARIRCWLTVLKYLSVLSLPADDACPSSRAAQSDHPVGLQSLWKLMRNEQHRHLTFEPIHSFGELLGGRRIEPCGRLVEDEDTWAF